MAENYFDNLRTVGSSLDQGISKLQETWKMPQLLLCNNSEQDQKAAKTAIEDLKNELRLLKEIVDENKEMVTSLRGTHTQFIEESTKAIQSLKDEVEDIKILFAENGYVEDPMDIDLSILNRQLESLFLSDSNSCIKDSDSVTESSACDNTSMYDSPTISKDSFNIETSPTNNVSFGSLQKRSLINERPMTPQYSPYYYKMMKK